MNEKPMPRVLAASQALEFQDSIVRNMSAPLEPSGAGAVLNRGLMKDFQRRMGGSPPPRRIGSARNGMLKDDGRKWLGPKLKKGGIESR